jgi:hypothetical protein
MTDSSNIAPSPELVQQWLCEFFECDPPLQPGGSELFITARAAQYGADQELEECCEWVTRHTMEYGRNLRAVRRPKPPSLKEQALKALEDDDIDVYLIRRALEALPDD